VASHAVRGALEEFLATFVERKWPDDADFIKGELRRLEFFSTEECQNLKCKKTYTARLSAKMGEGKMLLVIKALRKVHGVRKQSAPPLWHIPHFFAEAEAKKKKEKERAQAAQKPRLK
jgi:hypothetical protein